MSTLIAAPRLGGELPALFLSSTLRRLVGEGFAGSLSRLSSLLGGEPLVARLKGKSC